MIKKLSKHGDSLALELDPVVLKQLNIDENTPLEISTDGHAIVVSPVRNAADQAAFDAALASSNERYAETLRRLAE